MAKYKALTESGSTYIIDTTEMTWERPVAGKDSNDVRTEKGEIWAPPQFIAVGKPITIFGPPIDEEKDYRKITTSPVVSWEKLE